MYGKDDDVKEDADRVDDQGQEDGVLAGDHNDDKDHEQISILMFIMTIFISWKPLILKWWY